MLKRRSRRRTPGERPGERGDRLRFLWAVAVVTVAASAGCASEGGAGVSNFDLAPDRVGWNIEETAAFTLTLTPSWSEKQPAYTLDPDFALEEIAFKRRGVGFGGEFTTRDPSALDFVLVRDGAPVAEVRLTEDAPSVGLSLTIPNALHDATYELELKLFKVGWVSSASFRVNVP